MTQQLEFLQYLTQDGGAAFRERFPRAAFIAPYGSGKDFAASALGYTQIAKFAAPLYHLAGLLWPGFEKKLDGGRKLLQLLGAAGRGQVDAQYPVTVERCAILHMVDRLCATGVLNLGWNNFGTPDFWINRAIEHISTLSGARAFTDARYPNELAALRGTATQADVFFVACRPAVLGTRRRLAGYADDGAERDSSEALANEIARHVWSEGFQINHVCDQFGLSGIIWSDDYSRCPEGAWPLVAPNIEHLP